MCFRRKNRFDELTRDEVVDAICLLEREEELAEENIATYTEKIKLMMDEGRHEKDGLKRTLLVKKITLLNEKRDRAINSAMYILYNLRLSERLKDAIDDKTLVAKISSLKSINYLQDQRALALYLNNVLNTKISQEDVLTEADDTFMAIEQIYQKNMQIYGISNITEDKLLAFFEEGASDDDGKAEEEKV